MRYIIDRFEGKYVICEDESNKFHQIPKYRVPLEAKEGDSLIEKDGILMVDYEDTKERQVRIKRKLEHLF